MRAVRRLWTYTQDPTGVPVWMNNTTSVTAYVAPFAVELIEPVPSADVASSTTVCVPSQLATWMRLDEKRRVVTDCDKNVVMRDEVVAGMPEHLCQTPLPAHVKRIQTVLHFTPNTDLPTARQSAIREEKSSCRLTKQRQESCERDCRKQNQKCS
eukprot:3181542-Amphidinium_carterae.1